MRSCLLQYGLRPRIRTCAAQEPLKIANPSSLFLARSARSVRATSLFILPLVVLSACTTSGSAPIALSNPGFAGDGVYVAESSGVDVVPVSRPSAVADLAPQEQLPSDVAPLDAGQAETDAEIAAEVESDLADAELPELATTGTTEMAPTIVDPGRFPDAPVLTAQAELPVPQPAPVAVSAVPANPAPESTATVPVPQEPLAIAAVPARPLVDETEKAARPKAGQKFFANLFTKRPQKPVGSATSSDADQRIALAAPAPKPQAVVKQAFVTAAPPPAAGIGTALPGVDARNLFRLDDGKAATSATEAPVQLASATAAGLARLAPNGIARQTDRVDVSCFKPELVRMIKRIEAHYGKPAVVTSGYRSPKGNRSAGGASNSLHMYCAAADIQIDGVGKWALAKYLREMPGRGGVGTYCHTESVHIDIGSKRDWNWRCRKR